MAKKIKTTLIIQGDSEGGIRAVKATDSQLEKLDRQTRKNKRSASELSKAYTHVQKNAGKYALAAAAAAGGVLALTARTAAATRDTKTLADALGTSTGSLQAFGYAAQQVGIDTGKAADVVKDLQDKLGDAALTGGGELAPVLEKIGLSAKELIKQNPVQQLVAIGNAIQDLPRAEQVNVLESLSNDATRLLPLLKDNAAELKRYSQQARDFHIALGDDDVARLVQADQAMRELRGVAQGLGNELAIAVAPALEDAATQAGDLSRIFSDPAFEHGVQAIASATGFMAEQLAESVKQVGELADLVENFSWSKLGKAALSRTGPGYVMAQMGIGPFAGDDGQSKPPELAPITVTADAPRKSSRQASPAATGKKTAAVNKLASAYASVNGRLTQQIALFGKTGEVARIRYQIESGNLSKLSDSRKKNLLGMAEEIDKLNAQKSAVRALFPEWQKLQQASQIKASVANLPQADQAFGKRRATQLIQQSATEGLPQMQGLDPQYNGPFGEAGRLQDEQAKYEQKYQQRLESYRQYAATHQQDVATANAAIEALEADHQQRALQYQQQIQQAQRVGYEATFGELTSIVGAFAGEQSSAYRAMFAASKGFAIADALVSAAQGAAKALTLPFPANLAAVATVAAQGASIIAQIKGVEFAGQAHDGSSSLPRDGTYYMEGGERVIDRDANKDLTRYLNRANRTTQNSSRSTKAVFNITYSEAPGKSPDERQRDHQSFMRQLQQAIDARVGSRINEMVGNGEFDEAMAPYNFGRQQTVT